MRLRKQFDNITEALPHLTDVQRAILYFIAFSEHGSASSFYQLAKALKTTERAIDQTLKVLMNAGYLLYEKYSYYSYYYAVKRSDRLSLAVCIFSQESQTVRKCFAEMSYRWNGAFNETALWKIAESVHKNDIAALKDFFRKEPDFCRELTINSYFSKEGQILHMAVPDNMIEDITCTVMEDTANDDSRDNGFAFQKVEKYFLEYSLANKRSVTVINSVLDMINAHRFIYEGKEFKAKFSSGYYAFIVDGIKSLYGREPEAALKSFSAAMKMRNADNVIKNVFYEPTFCFLLILAYKMSGSVDSEKKLSQFLNKKTENDYDIYYPAIFAAKFVNTLEGKKGKEYLRSFQRQMTAYGRAALQYCLLFSKYLKSDIGNDIPDMPQAKPMLAIIRHELSHWYGSPIGEDLSSTFGGPPILGAMGGKEEWELQLDQLKNYIAKAAKLSGDGNEDEGKETRLAYFIDGSFVEVREQKKLKNGSWGAGKKVSYESFSSGKSACADDIDKKIMLAINKNKGGYYRRIELGEIIDELIGCDRVFLSSTSQSVKIMEDKVFISVKKTGPYLEIGSNVKYDHVSRGYLCFYSVSPDKRTYKVTKITKEQASLLTYLLGIGKFPLAAESALKKILPTLGKAVEIHSDLIEGGSSLEKKDGNPTVILRMNPEGDSCLLNVFVRPLDGGVLTSIPGEGSKVIFDQIDGKRYQVTRKLKAEKEAYDDFTDFCYEELGLSPTEEGEMELFPEEILEVLDNFGKDERFAFEWPEGKSMKIKGSLETSSFKMSLHSRESWFDVEGKVDIDGDSIPVAAIMELLSSGKVGNNFIRLSESEYLKISDSLRKQLQRLESLTVSSRGKSSISVFKVGQVAEILKSSGLDIKVDKTFNDLVKKIEASSKLTFDVPEGLNATLRDYQLEGFQWMSRLDSWGGGACLADDMGLGKTVQAIAFMLMKKDKGPSLVVAPASVVLNWNREIGRFAPSLNVTVLNSEPDRKKAIDAAKEGDIVLSTYGLLVSESDAICSKNWNVVCLDEAHTIKNRDTKMSAAAMQLSSSSRIILTGTPVQNYLGELWNLFQFLNPGLLGSFEQFHSKFTAPIEGGDKERSSQLKRIIQPFILRRTKAEVVDELPDKTDITRMVEFSPEETIFYEALRQKAQESLASEDKVNVNALAQITMLREAACSATLLKKDWAGSQSKISTLMELIPEILEGGNGLLVFSQFTSFLHLCAEELDKAAIPYFFLEGSTTIKKREEMVQDFQAGKKKLFLISLKAGGLGLNLTGANYVIHLDPWWNPAIEQQATDRAYRIGQKQNVTVYHLISQHTIEEKIVRLHKFKRDMADAILEGTNVSHALTMEELRDLVKL